MICTDVLIYTKLIQVLLSLPKSIQKELRIPQSQTNKPATMSDATISYAEIIPGPNSSIQLYGGLVPLALGIMKVYGGSRDSSNKVCQCDHISIVSLVKN